MNMIFSTLVMLLWLSSPQSVVVASGQGQKINFKVLERGDDWQCASVEKRKTTRNEIHQIANSAILNATGLIHTCNGTRGWRRVAFVNMTDTSYDCPTGLNLTTYSKRTCGRSHTTAGGCSSTVFSVGGLPYSRVCGRIRGYQFGATGAFGRDLRDIDSYYVDGVSLTHGASGSRQHIWTFASGLSEATFVFPNLSCPCDTAPPSVVPAFVGSDYFCESGLHSEWNVAVDEEDLVLYPDDVLWDGQNCTFNSTCCQLNNPPWFTKILPNAIIEDIELRICTYFPPKYGDVPIELIELYVQ